MKNLLPLLLLLFVSVPMFNSCATDDEMPIVMPPDPDPDPDPDPEPEKEPDVLDLPAAGLQVYLNFNENVDDQSGNEFHGIINGGSYVADRDSAEEGAYRLELGDYISFLEVTKLDFAGRRPYSIGAFVKYQKLEESLGRSIIISKFDGGVRAAWYLGINQNDKVSTYRNSVPWGMESAWTIDENKYYHLMTTFDGDVIRIYIDGEESASLSWNSHPGDIVTPILIGAIHSGGEILPRFQGEIDDLVIYDRALTETEIKNMVED